MYSVNFTGRTGSAVHTIPIVHPAGQRSRSPAPVELRVKDLAASRKFYSDLFGFVPADGYGFSDRRLVLVSPLLAHGYRCIVLTRDSRAANADGVMLELETAAELLDRYFLARLLGARTTPLVTRGRMLAVSVQDPDGHRIELRSGPVERRGRDPRPDDDCVRWGREAVRTPSTTPFARVEAQREPLEPGSDDPLGWFDDLCKDESGRKGE